MQMVRYPPAPLGILILIVLLLAPSGCQSREGEAMRQGINDAGNEVTRAARKVADAVRGDGR